MFSFFKQNNSLENALNITFVQPLNLSKSTLIDIKQNKYCYECWNDIKVQLKIGNYSSVMYFNTFDISIKEIIDFITKKRQ